MIVSRNMSRMLFQIMLLALMTVLIYAIPKGGGAGSGGGSSSGGGGSSSSGSGTSRYRSSAGASDGPSAPMTTQDIIIMSTVLSSVGLCVIGICLWKWRRYGRTTNHATGEETNRFGAKSDTSYTDFYRGLTYCNENPIDTTYCEPAGQFDFFPTDETPNIGVQRDDSEIAIVSSVPIGAQQTVLSNHALDPCRETTCLEVTLTSLPNKSIAAIGLCAKPYPLFRLPGWHRASFGWHSDDGNKFFDNSYGGDAFSPAFKEGDKLLLTYKRSTDTITGELNGKMFGEAFSGMFKDKSAPIYFAIGFEGAAKVHVKDPYYAAISSFQQPSASSACSQPSFNALSWLQPQK